METLKKISKTSVSEDCSNLLEFCRDMKFEELGYNTIFEYLNDNCFLEWKYRGTYNDLCTLINDLNSDKQSFDLFYYGRDLSAHNPIFIWGCSPSISDELFFGLIELIFNLMYCETYNSGNAQWEIAAHSRVPSHPFNKLVLEIEHLIDKYGLEKTFVDCYCYINPKGFDKLKDIITDANVLNEIYKYRSPSNAHNLMEKQEILCILGTYIDSSKESGKLAELKNEATFLLNNFGIRHKTDKAAKPLITSDENKEKIYDLTFNRILKYLSYKHYSEEDEFYKELKKKFDENNNKKSD